MAARYVNFRDELLIGEEGDSVPWSCEMSDHFAMTGRPATGSAAWRTSAVKGPGESHLNTCYNVKQKMTIIQHIVDSRMLHYRPCGSN